MTDTNGNNEDNLRFWNSLSTPESWALKPIKGGRLKGMTHINPQRRYKAMTQLFGPVGFGWKSTVDEHWTELGSAGEVMALQKVPVYYKVSGTNKGEQVNPIICKRQ